MSFQAAKRSFFYEQPVICEQPARVTGLETWNTPCTLKFSSVLDSSCTLGQARCGTVFFTTGVSFHLKRRGFFHLNVKRIYTVLDEIFSLQWKSVTCQNTIDIYSFKIFCSPVEHCKCFCQPEKKILSGENAHISAAMRASLHAVKWQGRTGEVVSLLFLSD